MDLSDRNTRNLLLVAGVLVGYIAWQRGVISDFALLYLGLLIPSIILHEVSHGAVALAFGDPTAQRAGRLTLNPVGHIDPVGTVIIPVVMVLTTGAAFGWAKPVPVNVGNLRSPRNHSLLVSLAGPATNLAIMALATIWFRAVRPEGLLGDALLILGLVNLVVAVFNLIPIPPLDGSALVERVLPRAWWPGYLRIREYSMLILFGLFLFVPGFFGRILEPAVRVWETFVLGA
jgi:Zn-dependent protease